MAWMGGYRPPAYRILFKCKTVHLFVDRMALWQFHHVHLCPFDSIQFSGISLYCIGLSEYLWMA